jgi:hypothetical protein
MIIAQQFLEKGRVEGRLQGLADDEAEGDKIMSILKK